MLGTRICWGLSETARILPSGSCSIPGPWGFLTSALSRPQVLLALTLVSLYRHPVIFVYAGSPCLECLLTSLLTKSFLIQETFIEPALGPGSGETKMSEARSLLCQELSALVRAMYIDLPTWDRKCNLKRCTDRSQRMSSSPSSRVHSASFSVLSPQYFMRCPQSGCPVYVQLSASSLKAWKQRQPVIHSWISLVPVTVFSILGLFIPSCVSRKDLEQSGSWRYFQYCDMI